MKRLILLFSAALILLLAGCGPVTGGLVTSSSIINGKLSLPGFASSENLSNYNAYIIGQNSQRVPIKDDGSFTIIVDTDKSSRYPFVQPTSDSDYQYSVLAHPTTPNTGPVGIKIQVPFVASQHGTAKELTPAVLEKVGGIAGRVKLAGESDHSGITVKIPGSQLATTTDTSGDYLLGGVPPGNYSHLLASKAGFDDILLTDITVLSDTTTDTGQTVLLPEGSDDASTVSVVAQNLDFDDFVFTGSDDQDSVSGDFELPLSAEGGTTISWDESSDSSNAVVISGGTVTVSRPLYPNPDATVVLTATVTKGSATETKEFTFTVKAQSITEADVEALDAADITFGGLDDIDTVRLDFTVPTTGDNGSTITWTEVTDTDDNVSISGGNVTVTRPAIGESAATVTIRATLSNAGAEDQVKEFTLTILAEVEYAIAFNANGGTGTMADMTGDTGNSFFLVPSTLTKTGESFYGWSTEPGGSVEYHNGAYITVGEAETELYAVWGPLNLLTNGDFETGDATGWTIVLGDGYDGGGVEFSLGHTPATGWSYNVLSSYNNCVKSQQVDIESFGYTSAELADTGTVIRFTEFINQRDGAPDYYTLTIRLKDASSTLIDSVTTGSQPVTGGWHETPLEYTNTSGIQQHPLHRGRGNRKRWRIMEWAVRDLV
jgi:hypothetical protein